MESDSSAARGARSCGLASVYPTFLLSRPPPPASYLPSPASPVNSQGDPAYRRPALGAARPAEAGRSAAGTRPPGTRTSGGAAARLRRRRRGRSRRAVMDALAVMMQDLLTQNRALRRENSELMD